MSDDLVPLLREGCVLLPKRWSGDTGSDRPFGLLDEDETDGLMSAAADRIEELTAERDTLAEIVGIISPHVEYDDQGWVGIVAGRNFHAHSRWTKSDAERFRAALDRNKENTE